MSDRHWIRDDQDFSQELLQDERFLHFREGDEIMEWFYEHTGNESWGETANRMFYEGMPCQIVYDMKSEVRGLMFEDSKHKLVFVLKMKL